MERTDALHIPRQNTGATFDPSTVAVIIPALNEADNLNILLPALRSINVGQILVCDNGSTDDTRRVTQQHGACWVHQPLRGYGAACFAGMCQLNDDVKVIVFMDADLCNDHTQLPMLVKPIQQDQADLVLSTRVASMRDAGAMRLSQRVANTLMPLTIRIGWGYRYTDMGPFRAISRSALEQINMKDRAFGWTIEMQIRAVELGLRIREVPVSYGVRRYGLSKISGTLAGTLRAAYWIFRTCACLWLTKRRRIKTKSVFKKCFSEPRP